MLTELRDKRKQLSDQAGAILTRTAEENREAIEPADADKVRALHAEVDKLTNHIQMRERQEELEQRLEAPQPRVTTPTTPGREPSISVSLNVRREDEAREFLRGWFLAGSDKQPEPHHIALAERFGHPLADKWLHLRLSRLPMQNMSTWEYRAPQAVTPGSAGGFTIPDEMMRPIEIALLTFGGMRARSTILRTATGADLPIPMTNDTANKGRRLAENTVVTQTGVVFSQLVLKSYKYSSDMVLASVEFLQDTSLDIAGFIGRILGERIGRILNDELTVGTGAATMPNGIVTAATAGVTGATGTTTSVTAASLIDLEHSVDPAYRVNGAFMMHDLTLREIKKLNDTTGRPLWLTDHRSGEPNTILGYPYVINQSMAVMAANAKSILFGDLSKYIIRDVVEISLQRLDERFADFHQVAFLAFSRHDGNLLDAGTRPVKYYANSAT
jgi:HK97 family phage major capsid protein